MTQRPSASPSRNRRPTPARSLGGSLWAVLFRPGQFFSSFQGNPRAGQQTALLALALIALSVWVALRPLTAPSQEVGINADAPATEMPFAPDASGPGVSPPSSLGGPGLGELPFNSTLGKPGAGAEQPTAGPSSDEVAANWLKGLRASLGVGLVWLLQAVFLCEVPLLRGRRPDLGLNLRLAVWANLPLALLIGLQSLFVASGGKLGAAGLSGMVAEMPDYLNWPPLAREWAMTFTGQFTIFWLWSMALLYQAARHSLGGAHWMALLIVVLWMASSTLLPAALRLLGVA